MTWTIVYKDNCENHAEIVAKYATKREAAQALLSIGGKPWGSTQGRIPEVWTFPESKTKRGTAYLMKPEEAKTYVRMTANATA